MPTRTLLSALEWGAAELKKAGKPSSRLDAELLLGYLMGLERIKLYMNFDSPISETDARSYVAMIRRRAAGEPVAYIRGFKEFYSRSFSVCPEVLIPRPETECMIEAALGKIACQEAVSVLDLCTGSGNIAITLASENRAVTAVGTDISSRALECARSNAASAGVGDRAEFLQGDLFTPVSGKRFDLVVSNPPYIPTEMIAELQQEISCFEPGPALDGGPDGMDFIRRIVAGAPGHMIEGALLFVEMAEWMPDAAAGLVEGSGRYTDFSIGNDLSGRPRFFSARLK
jgi:release factor glutamine methyltransferase